MNKEEKLNNWIKFFAICGAIAFLCGFVELSAFIACLIFGGIAATIALFKDRD